MRYIYIILLVLFLMIGTASAERYVVLNETNIVMYKGDTATFPILQSGEWLMIYQNINNVQKGAFWNGTVFINPLPALEPEEKRAIKDTYMQTMSDLESAKTDLAVMRNQTSMTEVQQTNNIRKLADYQYKIFDILGTILRFLKVVFWSN